MTGNNIVVVFDFDKTIIDLDSDNWVLDELGFTDLFNQLLPTMPWNSLMDRMMKEVQSQGKTIGDIVEFIALMDINGGALNQFGMEKLCMEAYLQGQDLWEIVNGGDPEMPAETPENAKAQRKWKIKCGKALFALRGSISKELIEHIRAKEKPKEIWQLLEQLFTKKHTARLQMLENELANTTQGNMTIAQYFQKIKSIYSEISEIDKEEPISEARLRR
ncbi:hypothetical protein Vadar_018048 [Vaccinium darrowii]|uniref:Uncharacterized protein n=1 Tax=Vaccinium darrowii TaxID=229202 RepID=A0ACB7YXF3_9ERIC|nr:hypothetical protein Vadar_018048 [Vaccinium darrowii]